MGMFYGGVVEIMQGRLLCTFIGICC